MSASFAMRRLVVVSSALIIFCASSVALAKGPVNRHHPGRSSNNGLRLWSFSNYSLTSLTPSTEARSNRRFSYDPSRFHAGDRVAVTADEAKLMSGTKSLGIAEKGQQFVVQRVEGPWLEAQIEMGGKVINGWIRGNHVARLQTGPRPGIEQKSGTIRSQVECHPFTVKKRPYRTNRRYRR